MTKQMYLNDSMDKKYNVGITKVAISGYKSLSKRSEIEIRPLTILAGSNSSGKSSIIQPLLLLKQTLDQSFDPGTLWLSGFNVKFTSPDQLLSRVSKEGGADRFEIELEADRSDFLKISFEKERDISKGFKIKSMTFRSDGEDFTIRLGMKHEEILELISPSTQDFFSSIIRRDKGARLEVIRNRCFLNISQSNKPWARFIYPHYKFESYLTRLIHLPGLRGSPERNYPATSVGKTFSGTFQQYAAGVIAQWQEKKAGEELGLLKKHLTDLELTWKVRAKYIDSTQVELTVGRLPQASVGGGWDLVNIADVGFGFSQVLPVLVALLVAEPGQMVYLEQPEIHLHPNAQLGLAIALADAARRGVRVVAETHSSYLLLGIQTLVAKGDLNPDLVALHWFEREQDGSTKITPGKLDAKGAFGNWPAKFDDILLAAQKEYLDLVRTKKP